MVARLAAPGFSPWTSRPLRHVPTSAPAAPTPSLSWRSATTASSVCSATSSTSAPPAAALLRPTTPGGPGGVSENGAQGFFRLLERAARRPGELAAGARHRRRLRRGLGSRARAASSARCRSAFEPGAPRPRPRRRAPLAATDRAGALGPLDADDGDLLQRRRLLPPLLPLDARAGHRRPGRRRHRPHVA